jgi:peptide/nickel transport system substrate-binding protein
MSGEEGEGEDQLAMRYPTRRSVLAAAGLSAGLSRFSFGQEPTPRRGGTLRISVDQAASVIHPLRTRVNPEHMVAELCYCNLTTLTTNMAPLPDLALSWSANPDFTEWTFKLRKGVVFTDGSPCTAKDVAATFVAILDPKTASPARTFVAMIKEAVPIDDETVLFRLNMPFADLPATVAAFGTRIVPAAIAQGDIDRLARESVGAGPFKLVSYEPDRLIVVERNPHYFIPDQPHLDRIEIRVYPDSSAETSALLSADNDLMVITSNSEFGRLKGVRGVDALQVPSGQFLNVNMACDQKPFNDLRVRKALSLCVDREALVGFVALDAGAPGQDVPVNSIYRYYKKQVPKKPDIVTAKRLLAEAGYADGLDVTLVASDNPGTRTQLGVAIREMAKPAGFRINVQTMPHATYLQQVWKKGSFYVGFYNTQQTIDAVFTLLYTSDASWNETRWNNAEFDKLVAEGRRVSNDAARAEIYGKAQDMMYAETPSIIPLFFDLLAGKRSYVKGYGLHPRGHIFRFEKVWLDEGSPKRG